MNAQNFFQDLATLENLFQSLRRHCAATVIPAQVGESLFTFKDCSRPNLFPVRPVGRQVRAISTRRHLHLEGADGITTGLRPEQSQAFESDLSGGLTSFGSWA